MAATRAVVRGRVQEILGDVDPSNRVVGQFRYDEVIGRNMHLLAGRVQMPQDAVASITLAAGTYDYAVHASLQYLTVAQVFLDSDGQELEFVPRDEFNAYYRQDTSQPRSSGTPREYTVYEAATTSLLRMRFGPTPDATDAAKVHASSLPALLSTDSSSIPFSNELLRGLESMCATEIALSLSPEQAARLGLDKSVVRKWSDDADEAIRTFNVRQRNLGNRQDRILRHGGRRVRSGAGRGW